MAFSDKDFFSINRFLFDSLRTDSPKAPTQAEVAQALKISKTQLRDRLISISMPTRITALWNRARRVADLLSTPSRSIGIIFYISSSESTLAYCSHT